MGNSFSKLMVPAASNSNVKLVGIKKQGSSTYAKLKQVKLDLRRHREWLSQVKNEGYEKELKGAAKIYAHNGEDTRSLKVTPTDGEKDGSMHNGNSSGSSSLAAGSAVESNCSGTNFSESSRSCSSGTSNSRNISEVEDDGCVDDWEVLADILAASDDKEDWWDQRSESLLENRSAVELDHLPEVVKQSTAIDYQSKPKAEFGQEGGQCDAFQSKMKPGFGQAVKPNPEKDDQKCKSLVEDISVAQSDHVAEVVKQASGAMDCRKPKPGNGLAWRKGDAFRPKSLPNPQKKRTFPIKEDRHHGRGGTTSGHKNFVSDPTPCPICSEDMDSTDLSFYPCSCGFQLCLFCHKRILEHCGRCPGCREHYDNNAVKWEENSDKLGDCSTLRLARSC